MIFNKLKILKKLNNTFCNVTRMVTIASFLQWIPLLTPFCNVAFVFISSLSQLGRPGRKLYHWTSEYRCSFLTFWSSD